MTPQERARKRAVALSPKPTAAMSNYLQILLNDCGYGNIAARKVLLSEVAERAITFIDDLTYDEAHKLIETLKAQKEDAQERASNEL